MTKPLHLTPAQEIFLNQTITNQWPKVLPNINLSNILLYQTLEARILQKNIIQDFILTAVSVSDEPHVGTVKAYIAAKIQEKKGGSIEEALKQIAPGDFNIPISQFEQAHKPSFKLVGEPGFCKVVSHIPQIGMKFAG